MNNLQNEWNKLSENNFIYTKHNYLDVYNFTQKKKVLIVKAIDTYCQQEKINKQIYDYKYLNSSVEDKKIIDNEIDLILKEDVGYKKLISDLKRVNKYKSKAFEEVTKLVLNELGYKLNGENNFEKIFEKISLDLKNNKDKYVEFKEDLIILNIENQFRFKHFNFKQFGLNLALLQDGQVLHPTHFKKIPIEKTFFEDDKNIFYFGVNKICPILRKRRGGNILFYELDGEITFKIKSSFDEVAREYYLNSNQSLGLLKQYYIRTTPKDFYHNFYLKSKFFELISKINQSHQEFRFKPLIKEFSYKGRPDLWEFKDGKLIFFEVKFNEFTEFNVENIINTVSYVQRFNIICQKENFNLIINEINIVHSNRHINDEIKKEIEKYKRRGWKINLISFEKIIEDYNLLIPSEIKIIKDGNKTKREVIYKNKTKNIIIDLTEVTNE